ncbi:MAG TPA: type II toxin-antitoxin system Phd/YefM family antitoxin [Gemmataceae bacterium]|nr:type II toxin-antitoxin system Phd/YefM family antitoxin [Gemmataceae bacterium]
MSTVTLEEAQAHLPQLIERLQPGEEIVITRDQKPVARLVAEERPKRKPRQPGNCKGMLTIVADDEEHLKDFAEYME